MERVVGVKVPLEHRFPELLWCHNEIPRHRGVFLQHAGLAAERPKQSKLNARFAVRGIKQNHYGATGSAVGIQ
jgi:hypothetical protein